MSVSINSRKAITQMIVISSLIVVGALAVLYVQDWFYLYRDQVETEVQTGEFSRDVDILGIDSTILTVNNQVGLEVVLDSVSIGTNECQLEDPRTLSRGLNSIDIGSCTFGMEHVSTQNVVLVSPLGIRSEDQVITNPPQNLFVVRFKSSSCNLALSEFELFTISDLENAHVSLENDLDSYRACGRFLQTTSELQMEQIDLFYLGSQNNSHVWTEQNPTTIIQPTDTIPITLEYPDSFSVDIQITDDNSFASTHTCVGKVSTNEGYGGHFWDCNSMVSGLETIWVEINDTS